MDTVLGLIGLVIWIVCVIALAALITWIVIKLFPAEKTPKPAADGEPGG
jgi:hypothetical protein